MSRRDNSHLRCLRCHVHKTLCFCNAIPRIETRTRVVLLMHYSEDRKPTNTGRLASECLPNSEIIIRGLPGKPSTPIAWDPASQPLLMFPHAGAISIAQFAASPRPLTLIVPDGTWRQASRVRARVPGLQDIPCVCLPLEAPSAYRLRSEPRPDGLATIEAIARALGILESPRVQARLELVFRTMVERFLWTRGRLATDAVTGGIPESALRYDPRGAGLARAQQARQEK